MKVGERKRNTSYQNEGAIVDSADIKVRILELFYKRLLML